MQEVKRGEDAKKERNRIGRKLTVLRGKGKTQHWRKKEKINGMQ